MTTDGLAGDALVPDPTGHGAGSLALGTIIAICDQLLGEIGRRSHFFGWLRAPDAGAQDWLAVDVYYPTNRLVVICRSEPGEHDDLYAELVPAHGLRLLPIIPAELGGDRTEAAARLERALSDLGPPPMPPAEPEEPTVTRAVAALAQPPAWAFAALAKPAPRLAPSRRPAGPAQADAARRAARFVANHPATAKTVRSPAPARIRPGPRAFSLPAAPRVPVRPARERRSPSAAAHTGEAQTVGAIVGLALVAMLCAEVYVAVAKAALESGRVVLGFGLALDACARALGTVAAERAGRPAWAWGCVIGGSPVVATFALFRSSGPEPIEPAPLAGLMSLLAMLIVVVGITVAT